MNRRELYVTNTVKFRPTKLSGAGRVVNRPPTQEEIRLFLPWLLKEIDMVDPACVITLGNVPLQALMGRKATIGDLHGAFADREGLAIYPMYHPASLIYNPGLKGVYRDDILRFSAWCRQNIAKT